MCQYDRMDLHPELYIIVEAMYATSRLNWEYAVLLVI